MGGPESNRKMAKMGWKRVCRPKVKGGFGVSNHEFKNQVLLSKWWWGFAKEPNSLWRKVLVRICLSGVLLLLG